jgi:hypothetical protein
MARTLINASIKINGTDVSNQGNKVVVKLDKDELDGTGFQSKFKQTEPGLADAAIEMTLFQTFGEGSVNTLLAKQFSEDEDSIVVVTPKEGVVSKDNPAFVLKKGKSFGYEPVGGDGPGQLMTTDVAFKNTGQEGVVELVKPEEVAKAEEEAEE